MQTIRSAIVMMAIAFLVTSINPTARAAASNQQVRNPTAVWSAWGGDAEVFIHKMIPEDMGLQISVNGARQQGGDRFTLSSMNLGSLDFHAPQGQFDDFISGSLAFEAPLTFSRGGHSVSMRRLFIEPHHDGYYPMLQMRDDQGRVLFLLRQIHVYAEAAEQRLVMERMDIHLTEEMAILLGEPLYAKQFIGELALNSNVNIPAGAETDVDLRGGACAGRPQWPTAGFVADVGLTAMGTVQDTGTVTTAEGVFELVTPSSSLKSLVNASGADVPWFTKFQGNFPPYNNDQHPYLAWNMYRFVDNRMEQIGVSGLKHAFLTINFNCTINCGNGGIPGADGHILWPGCEDVYGVGNNNSACDVGPRSEVNPRTGVFVSTGSFFDQNGDGSLDNCSSGSGENRMQVLREDLQTANADYYFESWYIIRDDSNIFNTMGLHPITPVNTSGNSWAYQDDPFAVGPVIDVYVPPGTNPNTGNQQVTFAQNNIGHIKLAVRTEDLGNGQWRYNYMLMNYDVNEGVDGLQIPFLGGNADDILFHDPDADAANDWTNTSDANGLTFNAPAGELMEWYTGYTFSFTVAAPPEARTLRVLLGPGAAQSFVTMNILGPGDPDLILIDGFEAP
ncbi:MAG: hypothetical protein Tsb002_23690 [Wenzhouxiangellaceae bacterium]